MDNINRLQKKNYFVQIPYNEIVRDVFSLPNIMDELDYRMRRVKKIFDNYEDVFDGELCTKNPLITQLIQVSNNNIN